MGVVTWLVLVLSWSIIGYLMNLKTPCQPKQVFELPIEDKTPEEVKVVDISSLSSETFLKEYVMMSKPVVIKGGAKDWRALKLWTNTYLRKKMGDEVVKVEFSKDNVFRYTEEQFTQTMPFSMFVDRLEEASTDVKFYITGIPNVEQLFKDIKLPEFSSLLSVNSLGFWMGSGGQITPAHFDEMENIMCVVSGKKRFTLFSPLMSRYMYPIYKNDLYASAVPNISQPDHPQFPLFKHAKGVQVTLEPGDLLFTPSYWWHQVESFDRNIGVNFFFYPHSWLLQAFYAGAKQHLPESAEAYVQQQVEL